MCLPNLCTIRRPTYYLTFSARGVNTYNAYVARLNVLLAQAIATNPPGSPAPVVPACWPVYHDATVFLTLRIILAFSDSERRYLLVSTLPGSTRRTSFPKPYSIHHATRLGNRAASFCGPIPMETSTSFLEIQSSRSRRFAR